MSPRVAPKQKPHKALEPHNPALKSSPRRKALPLAERAPTLGHRHTRQREIIAELIRSARGPLTIAQIHGEAQSRLQNAENPKAVGIATVYRTINLLQEGKQIRAVILPSGETRYESSHLDAHHHHFQCRECTLVFDLESCPVGLPEGTTLPGGFRVESHELTLFGICPDCLPARKAKA